MKTLYEVYAEVDPDVRETLGNLFNTALECLRYRLKWLTLDRDMHEMLIAELDAEKRGMQNDK
jgi:hypothetical protein